MESNPGRQKHRKTQRKTEKRTGERRTVEKNNMRHTKKKQRKQKSKQVETRLHFNRKQVFVLTIRCLRAYAHHSCLMPLDGSVVASCAGVSESSIRWGINQGCVFFKLVKGH